MQRCWCIVIVIVAAVVALGETAALAQAPRPRPRPRTPAPSTPATPPAQPGAAAPSRRGEPAPEPARILLVADVAGRLWVDGREIGVVEADVPRSVVVGAGQHIVSFLTRDGAVRRQATVAVQSGQQELVELVLKGDVAVAIAGAAAEADTALAVNSILERAESLARDPWIRVDGGAIDAGCVPQDRRCLPDERQVTRVTVPPLDVMKTEVTVHHFRLFSTAARTPLPRQPVWSDRPDMPVVNVPWNLAVAFCGWAGGRLPTEAEWEYAARGGAAGRIYEWGDEFAPARTNGFGAPGGDRWIHAAPAGSFDPNAFGIHDLTGNVWEWTADAYAPGTAAAAGVKALRGGSYSSVADALRVSVRARAAALDAEDTIGFRCVRDVR